MNRIIIFAALAALLLLGYIQGIDAGSAAPSVTGAPSGSGTSSGSASLSGSSSGSGTGTWSTSSSASGSGTGSLPASLSPSTTLPASGTGTGTRPAASGTGTGTRPADSGTGTGTAAPVTPSSSPAPVTESETASPEAPSAARSPLPPVTGTGTGTGSFSFGASQSRSASVHSPSASLSNYSPSSSYVPAETVCVDCGRNLDGLCKGGAIIQRNCLEDLDGLYEIDDEDGDAEACCTFQKAEISFTWFSRRATSCADTKVKRKLRRFCTELGGSISCKAPAGRNIETNRYTYTCTR